MIKKLKIKNYGFTLFEVILYVSILSTMVFGIGSFVNLVSQVRARSQTMAEVDAQASEIIQNMTQIIRNSNSISSPLIGENQISLNLIDKDNNSAIFSLDGDKVMVDYGTGTTFLNNDRVFVEDLLFKNLSRQGTPTIIQINFTISYKNNSENKNYDYSKTYVASASLSK
jgi:hypothetical protein